MIDMTHTCIESTPAIAGSVLSASLAYLVLSTCIAGCSGTPPSNLGVRDGRLAPCPSSPNCVSSQSTDRQHTVEPLQYKASAEEAMSEMKNIIGSMKRTRIVSESGNYLHAEFTSALWRFVDDVEFYFDDSAKVIHLRSASRLGKSDFGVNRKRVEAIRNAWKVRGK
jgi:uncharacterized protein (DUF1499 family)